eukprot:9493543-Pyramimonas_sp.AAC.1
MSQTAAASPRLAMSSARLAGSSAGLMDQQHSDAMSSGCAVGWVVEAVGPDGGSAVECPASGRATDGLVAGLGAPPRGAWYGGLQGAGVHAVAE